MPDDDALLFMDANKYLDLYRASEGKKLLGFLSEQVSRIFITEQVVCEVLRNKIDVARDFIAQMKILKLETCPIPEHLFGSEDSESIQSRMSKAVHEIKSINEEVARLSADILTQIAKSLDDVSLTLRGYPKSGLFVKVGF